MRGTAEQPIPGREGDHIPTHAGPRDPEDEGERVSGRDEKANEGEESTSAEIIRLPTIGKTISRREEDMRSMCVTKTVIGIYGKQRGVPDAMAQGITAKHAVREFKPR